MEEIDTKAHYFTLLHPLEYFPTPYGPLISVESSGIAKWVECEIDEEELYQTSGYRVVLRSVEPGFGKNSFYTEDFLSLMKQGYIVKKEPGMYCDVDEWIEPITSTVYVHHTGYVLKRKNEGR